MANQAVDATVSGSTATFNFFDDRDALYGPLKPHHLRIGDTQFFVPPTSISVHHQIQSERVYLMRARGSLPKESGYFTTVITFTLFFPDMDSINYELRPLLAQVKKCPFLPVENTYLNEVYQIDAIAISGLTVQTNPGFPGTLTAILQCYAFDPATYIYDDPERTFDQMFNWPLFRWYYSRNLEPSDSARHFTFYEPLTQELDDSFVFRIAAEDDLQAIREWRLKKNQLIQDWLSDKGDLSFEDWLKVYHDDDHLLLWGKSGKAEKFNDALDTLYSKAMFEYDIHYETWNTGDLILSNFAISFENQLAIQQLQMDESPTFQYMGCSDTLISVQFTTTDPESVASLNQLIKRTAYLTREYHKEVVNGFLQFDHQLARLFGVKNVVIDDIKIDTVEGYPDLYQISLTMMAYNRAEKKLHEVKALTLDLNWNISSWDDATAKAVIPFIGPFLWLKDRPIFKSKKTISEYFKLELDAEKQAIYDAAVLESFKFAELYPDLELPTYEEVAQAGFEVQNFNDGIFVDPDFFLVYKEPYDFAGQLNKELEKEFKTELRDATGSTATISGNKIELDDKAKEKLAEYEKIVSPTSTSDQSDGNSITGPESIDTKNFEPDEMEALIRNAAIKYNIDQIYPLAFVKAFDTKLRHFYEAGVNADFENIHADNTYTPILMTNDFSYTRNENDSAYIGVMRVMPTNGNPEMLKKKIDYNVEQGVKFMASDLKTIQAVYEKDDDYHFQYLLDLFNLNGSDKEDYHTAEFIAALFIYLGFERELNDLLSKNKRPQTEIVKLFNRVINQIGQTTRWKKEDVKKAYDELPVKDYTFIKDETTNKSQEIVDDFTEDDFDDPKTIRTSMCHDALTYDRRGRLVRAFPSFFMTFVDEGQYVGSVKMSDQYFQYRAISDISFNNSRKQAASTLVCEMSNVFGSLDDAEKNQDLTYTSTFDVFQSMIMPGAVAKQLERNRRREPSYYKSIMLRTGTRIHLRMGYGSNIEQLPTIINGTITSIQNNGATLTVVAQNDGIELTNKLNAIVDPKDTTEGFLRSKKEPTEIVDELLTDSRGFWANISAALSNKAYEKHSLGIMHFGQPGDPQGWSEFKGFFTHGLLIGGNREISEINMNVYKTTGLLRKEENTWWSEVQDALGLGQADEANININLYDKTVWDILNIVAAIGDDYITAVHPFNFRNTIFLGKPYFPIHYGYVVEDDKVTGTKVKAFRQIHIYDSYTSIISNEIKATEENMYTVAVGTYLDEGKIATTKPIYVDTNIWPEKQRVVNIDTTLNAKGIKLVGDIPIIGDLLNKPAKWYFDEGVAIKITASGLRDYVKDMYDGYLIVLGDPSVKPYDQFYLQDIMNSMSGPADVKEVVHFFNLEQGFVTMIRPDVIVFNNDKNIYNYGVGAWHAFTSAMTTWALNKILRSKGFNTTYPIFNAIWAGTRKSYRYTKAKFDNNLFNRKIKEIYEKRTGRQYKSMTSALSETVKEKLKQSNQLRMTQETPNADIERWKDNGMLDKVSKNLDNISSDKLSTIIRKGSQQLSKLNLMKSQNLTVRQMASLSQKASGLLKNGAKSLGKIARGASAVIGGAELLTGPPGWIAFGIECAVTFIVTATIGEFTKRKLMSRHACIIVPLKREGQIFVAGINGHKGSVVGDSNDLIQSLASSTVGSIILGMIGVDAQQYAAYAEAKDEKSKSSSTEMLDPYSVLKGIQEQRRPNVVDDGTIEKLYKEDLEAKKKEWGEHLAYLAKIAEINIVADYSDIEKKGEALLSKIKNWFANLLNGGDESSDNSDVSGEYYLDGKAVHVSKQVKEYEPTIRKYAKQYGIEGFTPILMAFMMQESGGRGNDPMQSSESLGKPPNSLTPEESIKQGVKYFASVLKKANYDVKLALQSYNFGGGFIDYVKKHGGKYTKQLAIEFSNMKAKQLGWSRYGDPNYVDHVLRYYEGSLTPKKTNNGGTEDAPSVVGSEGKKKYHLSEGKAKKILINAKNQKDRAFDVVDGTGLMRKGTYELLNELAKRYKKETGIKLQITSAYRPGDPDWHGTGFAVDIDTPNTMKYLSGGKLGFPNGKDRDNAKKLMHMAAEIGFDGFVFGDYYLLQDVKSKYKAFTVYRPQDHYNHLHLSYPKKKK